MTTETSAARDFVLRTARENDVKFIRLWFTDILGKLKGFAVTADDLEDALERGVGFDGSAIDGFARHHESDMRAHPDPSTFNLLPWRPRQNAVARMFCDIRQPRGPDLPRRPAAGPEAQPGQGGGDGVHLQRGRGAGILLPEERRRAGTAGPRRLL